MVDDLSRCRLGLRICETWGDYDRQLVSKGAGKMECLPGGGRGQNAN